MMLIYFSIAFVITIVVHELAHALIAILCKVKIKTIAIGFGYTIYQKTIKNIVFKINLIPFGGFCKLSEDSKAGWLTKPYFQKLSIVLAGVTANLILAIICYLINYGSIKTGIQVDFLLMKSIFVKDYNIIYIIMTTIIPNTFLIQLSLLNLFSCITNLIPIPALDGGYIWLLLLEKKVKNFPKFLDRITKVGFVVLMIVQFVLIYYIWFI